MSDKIESMYELQPNYNPTYRYTNGIERNRRFSSQVTISYSKNIGKMQRYILALSLRMNHFTNDNIVPHEMFFILIYY